MRWQIVDIYKIYKRIISYIVRGLSNHKNIGGVLVQKETKKKLGFGVFLLGIGLVAFVVAINFNLPIIGLIGTSVIMYGGTQAFECLVLGIYENIENKKYLKRRKEAFKKKQMQVLDYIPDIKESTNNVQENKRYEIKNDFQTNGLER